jgi:hypothetical protein
VLGDTDEKFCDSHQMYLLDGTPLPHDECPMAQVVVKRPDQLFLRNVLPDPGPDICEAPAPWLTALAV